MKKKLEADLISIAHRILKLKNKEDLTQLHLQTQKLYEKLSVLKFVEENFSDVKPTIGNSNIQELVNDALENESEVEEVEVAVAPEEQDMQVKGHIDTHFLLDGLTHSLESGAVKGLVVAGNLAVQKLVHEEQSFAQGKLTWKWNRHSFGSLAHVLHPSLQAAREQRIVQLASCGCCHGRDDGLL